MTTPKEYEWQHLNSRRNYPFTDSSTLKVGAVFIPKNWALDASFSLNCGSVPNNPCYISKVKKTGNSVSLILNVGETSVAEAQFDVKTTERHIKFYSTFSSRYAGSIVVDPVYTVAFSSFPEGSTTTPLTAAVFCPSTVYFVPSPTLTSIRAHGTTEGVTGGEVYLVGGDGVELLEESGKITINIKGDPNYIRLDCGDVMSSEIVRLHSITPAYTEEDGTIQVGSPISAGSLGGIVFSASDGYDGDDDNDSYEGEKPTLRIHREGNKLMFDIAGLNKTVS